MYTVHSNQSEVSHKKSLLFDKQDTACLKGIAILMMVFHHCFAFPQWYKIPISFGNSDFLISLGKYGSCCIFIFAIITGYTYALHKDKSLLYSCKKIAHFLFSYLFIVVLLYIIAYIITGYIPTLPSFIAEFSRAKGPKLIIYGWYVLFHVTAMFLLPWYARLDSATNISRLSIILAVTIGLILFSPVSELRFEYMFPALILGYTLASDINITKFLSNYSKKTLIKYILAVIASLLSFKLFLYFRYDEALGYLALFSPILIIVCYKYLLPLILSLKLNVILSFLGKHSMNIWFIHCIFTSQITAKPVQEFVYIYDNIAWIYLTTLLLSLLASIIVTPLQTRVTQFLMRLFFTPKETNFFSHRTLKKVFLAGVILLSLVAFRNLWCPRYYELSFDYKTSSPVDFTIYYKRSDKSTYPAQAYSETYRTDKTQGKVSIKIPNKQIENISLGVSPLSDTNEPIEVSNLELIGRDRLKFDLKPSSISSKHATITHQSTDKLVISDLSPKTMIMFKKKVNMIAGKKRIFIPEHMLFLFLGILPLIYILSSVTESKEPRMAP